LKRYEEAIYDYTNSLELDLNFANAYIARGNFLKEIKEYLLAYNDF
jgi:hypothetical protein